MNSLSPLNQYALSGTAAKSEGVPENVRYNADGCSWLKDFGTISSSRVKPGCFAPSSTIILLAKGVLSGAIWYANSANRQVRIMITIAARADGLRTSLDNMDGVSLVKLLCCC